MSAAPDQSTFAMTQAAPETRENIRSAARLEASGHVLSIVLTHLDAAAQASFGGIDEKTLDKAIRTVSDLGSDFAVEGVVGSPNALHARVSYLPPARNMFSVRLVGRDPMTDPTTFLRKADRLTEQMRRSVLKTFEPGQQLRAQVLASWQPGPGLTVVKEDSNGAPAINARIDELKALASRSKNLAVLAFFAAVLLVGVGVVYSVISKDAFAALLGFAYALPCAALGQRGRASWGEAQNEIAELSALRDLQSIGSTAERLARQLFRINELEVRRYYTQSLRQRTMVFVVGVGVIAAGLGLAAYSIHVVSASATASLNDKIVIAALGAAGTISSNLVAAIFLRMFSAIVKSSTTFHDRLVLTHHVHYGNVLAASIEDGGDTRRNFGSHGKGFGSRINRAQRERIAPAIAIGRT